MSPIKYHMNPVWMDKKKKNMPVFCTVEMTKRSKHTMILVSIKHIKNIKHKRAHFAQTQHNNYEAASLSTSPTLGLNTFHTSSSIRH